MEPSNCQIYNITQTTCFQNDSIESIYNLPSPVECYKLRIIGTYCLVLFLFSLMSNGSLLWLFAIDRQLRASTMNVFIIAITAFNFFGTLFELPWVIVSNLYCHWVFGKYGCIISAYLMYTIGCASIYIMVAISFERYYVIYRPMSIRTVALKVKLGVVFICLLIGIFWATMPLVGWSHYSLEGALTSCSVEWKERSLNVTSYNITIFGIVYMMPIVVILTTNIKLISLVKKMPRRLSTTVELNKKRAASERHMTIIIMALIAIFLLSWTPYALVSMYSAFIDSNGLPPLAGTIPAIFAKSSMLWTSLIFIVSNQPIRAKLLEKAPFFGLCFSNSSVHQSSKIHKNIVPDLNATAHPTYIQTIAMK